MYAKISAWRPPGFVLPAAIQIVRYGYLFLIGLALLTFGGWLLPWPMLLRWLPGMPLISCDTAVCLILAAVALAAQVRESAAVLRLVSILLTALSGVYLLTPLVRVCFSVHYFLPGLTAAVTPAAHFRIASGTALVFMLFGISLLLMAQRRPGKFALRLAGGLSTAIVAIGVLGCVTALTGILSQHTLSSFLIRMAIPTATGACVLGICAQAVWWTKSAHSAQQVASSWANFALLGLLILFAGVDSTIASNADQAMKTRTDFGVVSSQINLVRTIVTAIREAEIGMRGFLLTGEDAFLSDYERATKEAFAGVKTLRQNAPDAETEEFRYAARCQAGGVGPDALTYSCSWQKRCFCSGEVTRRLLPDAYSGRPSQCAHQKVKRRPGSAPQRKQTFLGKDPKNHRPFLCRCRLPGGSQFLSFETRNPPARQRREPAA